MRCASRRPEGPSLNRSRLRAVLMVILLSGVGACAESFGARRMTDRDNARITTIELGRLNVSNAYDAVLQLRPMWLKSRGRRSARALPTEIVVAQNGSYFGPISS